MNSFMLLLSFPTDFLSELSFRDVKDFEMVSRHAVLFKLTRRVLPSYGVFG